MLLARRAFLIAAATLPFAPALAAEKRDALAAARRRIAALEKKAGGRLGVYVRDSGSGAELVHRARERFPMCSTFKFLAAAAVLKKVDAGKLRLDQDMPMARGICSNTPRRPRSTSPTAICGSAISAPRRSSGATTPPRT